MRIPRLSIIILCSILFTVNGFSQYSKVITKGDKIYLANTLILKMKGFQRTQGSSNPSLSPGLSSSIMKEGMISSEYALPYSVDEKAKILNEIIIVTYSGSKDPEILADELKRNPEIEWCEPKFLYEPAYVPNDPFYSSQYNLTKIQAAQAWDITKGDSTIIIGIVDTGVDWDHPDLAANIWVNPGEIPGNGIDDDGNSMIDDIRGWDFGGLNGTPDNNPMEDRSDHGTHVAGIASAVTDNGTGVASIGYNSTIMPVKTSRDDIRNTYGQALIYYGNEGILYAANNGAKVINLSWGGGGYSVYGQEVINYAVSKGALVVAAAGNNASSQAFYPAAFNGVLCVGATNSDDTKASYSNYGMNLDVSAPGTSINSTWQNDTYTYLSGTSMASPLTAGLAALVAFHFPDYTPMQVAEQIRVNCDDIYTINPAYNYFLGKGRINAFKALNNTSSKSVRAFNFTFADLGDGDGIFEPGETISAKVDFANYLNPTNNLVITVELMNNYCSIVNGSFNAGQTATLDTFTNAGSEFTFQLNNSIPNNTELMFRLMYNDGLYTDFQLFKVLVNPSYADQSNGTLSLTIGSDGTIGFTDFPNNIKGTGFHYMESGNLLFEGALMTGTSVTKISDAARINNDRSYDFTTLQPFILSIPGDKADQQGLTFFNDDPAGANKNYERINLSTYSYSNDEDDDYIILRYNIKNTGTTALSDFYAGIFFDWDFADASSDSTGFDPAGNLAYVYRTLGNPSTRVAIASVNSMPTGYYGIRNDGSQGTINLFDGNGFSDAEKWTTLTTPNGPGAGPGDISMVISSGPYNINAGDSADVAFAIAGGDNIDSLRNYISRARLKFGQILVDVRDQASPVPEKFSLSQNYPNPFNPSTKITYSVPEAGVITLKIYNLMGEETAVLVDEMKEPGVYNYTLPATISSKLSSGVYFYTLKSGGYSQTKKMILLK